MTTNPSNSLLAALALASTVAVTAPAAQMENDALAVALDERTGALAVTDRRTARTWTVLESPLALAPGRIRRGTDEKTRMPIFEMVYHGCSVAYWDWCDYNFKFPKIWWKRDLFNALCGTPPLYFFNEETWKRFRDRLRPSYEVTTPVARATYSTPMKAYRLLAHDRSVQRVEFESGVASTVNFGDRPFVMKDGCVLPPHGHRFEGLPEPTR